MPGSEITITVWTDAPASRSLASTLADDAAKSVFRTTGLSAAVAAFDARTLEPREVSEAERAFSRAEEELTNEEDASADSDIEA